ncbi:MAG TPA: hypothetical protein VMG82_37530 [Candidatus Sulfotelmatobacter sp.]|nr:hypothetical protein [Candidatus Sulfotelmatobacter sp.]
MNIFASILLAMMLSIGALAQSQDQSGSQGSQGQNGSQAQGSQNQSGQTQPSNTASGSQNMSGTVSHNGKNFTNDRNNRSYKVDNPDALKGKADQHVALLVQVDPDDNVIHVVQIEPPQ